MDIHIYISESGVLDPDERGFHTFGGIVVASGAPMERHAADKEGFMFGAVVDQDELDEHVYDSEKRQRRYLDYVLRCAVKRELQCLAAQKAFSTSEVETVRVHIAEYETPIETAYELREALEEEIVHGTLDFESGKREFPVLPKADGVEVGMCTPADAPLLDDAARVAC